ncbi:MAG: alpha/beta hydrolase [bacterium]|nr:alpha/beta hydrolase [bacterium]
MLRRLLLGLVLLIAGAIVLPPVCSSFSSEMPPELPPPGRRIALAGGLAVNLMEEGSGPPVVLVHGLPGTGYDWQNTSAALAARGMRALAYDRVGYGRSAPRPDPASQATVGNNAAELLSLLEVLDLRNATVVGWSYGGVTAMVAAMRDPSRMGRLLLVGTGGPDSAEAQPPDPGGFMRFLYSDPVLAWRSRVPAVGRALISVLSTVAFSEKPMPDWWIPNVTANFSRWETLLAYRGEMFSIPSGDASFPVESIDLPTLLLHGDDDRLAPLAIPQYLAGVIPGAELKVYPGGSHMLPVLQGEAIADDIVGFLGR